MNLQVGLSKLETFSLIKSYEFGRSIDRCKNNPVLSRLHALAIPVICLLGEVVKVCVDTIRLIGVVGRSIIYRKMETGNVHAGVMHFSEHLRNIAGVITGLFIGLYSPKKARDMFLTVEAKKLTEKLDPLAAAKLYSLGYGIAQFFDKHGIDYRMCSGTILAAVRNEDGGIIPWDDDIDLMLHPTSNDKLKQVFEDGTFKKETGLDIQWQPLTGGWQIFHGDSPKGEGPLKEIGMPFVDVFCTMFNESGARIDFKDIKMRSIAANEYYTTSEWNGEAVEYDFGPIKLKGVKDSKPFIHRAYDEDCLDFAYQTMHHEDLAKMWKHPGDIKGHIEKIQRYGLPRRTYLANKASIVYDAAVFKADRKRIDEALSPEPKPAEAVA